MEAQRKYDQTRNRYQNILLHRLLDRLKIDEDTKKELVYQYTKERETSSAKMTWKECENLLDYLRKLDNQQAKPGAASVCVASDRMRKKILSICHDLNWRKDGKIDWDHLNSWLKKSGYLHKGLNRYTKDELPKLVTQFVKMKEDYDAKGEI